MAQRSRIARQGRVLSKKVIKRVTRYKAWDCSSCGNKGINANKAEQCFSCGSRWDTNDSVETPYRTKTKVDNTYKFEGVDLVCECGIRNKKRFTCSGCGRDLDPKFAVQTKHFTYRTDDDWQNREVQIDAHGFVECATDTPWNDGSPVVLQAPFHQPEVPIKPSVTTRVKSVGQKSSRMTKRQVQAVAQASKAPTQGRNPLILLGAAVFVAIIMLAGAWLYNKYTTLTGTFATAVEASWTYTLPLQDYALRYKTHETESLFWSPPEEAVNENWTRVVIRTEDIYGSVWVSNTCTRSVTDTVNNGDGTWDTITSIETYDCSGYETQIVGEEQHWGRRWTYQLWEWKHTEPFLREGGTFDTVFEPFVATELLKEAGEPVWIYTITYEYTSHDGEVQTVGRNFDSETSWRSIMLNQNVPALIDGFGTLRAIEGVDAEYQKPLE